MTSRRDLLAAFLGLPAALAGCARRLALPEGRIVGAGEALGHRLRDQPPPRLPADVWKSVPIVIVGGGVAGLSAAWRLRRAGVGDFVVLELESRAGGTSRSEADGIVPHPWGAHYLPAPFKENHALVGLLDEMGVVEGTDDRGEPIYAEQTLVRDPQERLNYRGRWYDGLYLHAGESEDDREQHRRFQAEIDRWVGWRDGKGRRAFTVPVAACSDDSEVTALDRLTMAEWLDQHGFTSPRLRWFVEYGCRDDYGSKLADTSAWSGLFYFAARRRVPGAEPQPYLTWPEGNGRLVAHLATAARERMHLGLAVADVNPTTHAGRSTVEVTAIGGEPDRVAGYRADQVIFAAPQFLTRHLIRPYRERPPAHLAAFDYGAWMVANLHLHDRPVESDHPLCWDNVNYESPSLGYVVATHQRGLDQGPTIFTYYYPLCESDARASRQRLQSLDWNDWAEVTLADLERMHPNIRGLADRLDVMRWGHAMIRPKPGFVWSGERRTAARPIGGVHFAHSDLSGIALFEEAFHHGIRAAEEVLAARGVNSPSIL